ncbi:MAG: response regulator [bacterium]|nr:response regulator [bacterium]
MTEHKILIIDDEELIRKVLNVKIRETGHETLLAQSGEEAIRMLKENKVELVFCDVLMPQMNGFEVLQYIKKNHEDVIVIIMTAYANLKTAIKAFDYGAFDYLIKPFTMEEIPFLINRALVFRDLLMKNKELEGKKKGAPAFSEVIGMSDYIQSLRQDLSRVTQDNKPVLITGPSGTGKKFLAGLLAGYFNQQAESPHYINFLGDIRNKEEEIKGLFHPGFTGRFKSHSAIIENCDAIHFSLQTLIPGQVQPDVKYFFLTQERITPANYRKFFIPEFYSLVQENIIRTISLKEHKEDIPLLIRHFLEKYNTRYNKKIKDFDKDSFYYFLYYHWPHNIRELEHMIEKVVMLSQDNIIKIELLHEFIKDQEDMKLVLFNTRLKYKDALRISHQQVDQYYIPASLKATDNNKTKAAKLLGISLRQFQYKCKELGI